MSPRCGISAPPIVVALVVVALLVALATLAAPVRRVAAQPYAEPTLRLSADRVAPGDGLLVEGSGFLPATEVDVTLGLVRASTARDIDLATVAVGDGGAFDVLIAIPATSPVGRRVIVVRGTGADGGLLVLDAGLVISSTPDLAVPGASTDSTGVIVAAAAVGLAAAAWGIKRGWVGRPR